MNRTILSDKELDSIVVGEALTITGVMALVAAVVMAVVIYKLFTSTKGSTSVPGGWKFSWN